MNKQIFFGFVIFSLAGMMMTSQMPLAYADEIECVNETLTGNIQSNITIPGDPDGFGPDGIEDTADDGLNVCVYDGIDHKGNTTIKDNASLHVTGGSNDEGDIKVEGKYSAINFEASFEVDENGDLILDEDGKAIIVVNTKKGNIQLAHEDSYAFITALELDGNINGKGELYISSNPDRVTGGVFIDGNILLDGNGDNELRVDGGEITGNLRVFKNHSYLVNDAIIGGNLEIREAFNGVGSDFDEDSIINIENNEIGGNLKLEDNNLPATTDSNTVGGNLLINKNSEPVTVDNSNIAGNANCKDNNTAPTGSGNTVDGKKKQQCENI